MKRPVTCVSKKPNKKFQLKDKRSSIHPKNNVNYFSKSPYETRTEDYIAGDADREELRKELPPTTNVKKFTYMTYIKLIL